MKIWAKAWRIELLTTLLITVVGLVYIRGYTAGYYVGMSDYYSQQPPTYD